MNEMETLAAEVIGWCLAKGLVIATAESCTGGLVAGAITAIPGSSAVFDRGFVTYSNQAKTDMLGVPAAMIAEYGAVSAQVAQAMAEGALANSNASIAVAITGVAGPDGGTPAKPVGTVVFSVAIKNDETATNGRNFIGNRDQIRHQSVIRALKMLMGV